MFFVCGNISFVAGRVSGTGSRKKLSSACFYFEIAKIKCILLITQMVTIALLTSFMVFSGKGLIC
jgi:hypothetical protein